jgi:hypothetical protein
MCPRAIAANALIGELEDAEIFGLSSMCYTFLWLRTRIHSLSLESGLKSGVNRWLHGSKYLCAWEGGGACVLEQLPQTP